MENKTKEKKQQERKENKNEEAFRGLFYDITMGPTALLIGCSCLL